MLIVKHSCLIGQGHIGVNIFIHQTRLLIELPVDIIIFSLLNALLNISPQYFQAYSIVTGYRAHSIHYVNGILSKESNGNIP